MIRIGIICPSEIAIRRFLPALKNLPDFEFIGVAIAEKSEWIGVTDMIIKAEKVKAKNFTSLYGGKVFDSYNSMIQSKDIDAIYLPLPPALHYQWSRKALLAGKHILVEKPATTSFRETKDLLIIAKKGNLAVHENYMFTFHNQLNDIDNIIKSGEIGDVRIYRISFGFPRRAVTDFRFNKDLGGGALLDAGGYTIKYASKLLGHDVKLVYAHSNFIDDFKVDIAGSAAMINEKGETAQIAFGMDNDYKCDLEVWGSKGSLTTCRVLTAPPGFVPIATLKIGNKIEERKLSADDAFTKSILHFKKCIVDENIREINFNIINRQAQFVQSFIEKSKL